MPIPMAGISAPVYSLRFGTRAGSTACVSVILFKDIAGAGNYACILHWRGRRTQCASALLRQARLIMMEEFKPLALYHPGIRTANAEAR